MIEIWYAILVVMLGVYVVLDGWNIGTGITHYAISGSQGERASNIAALGSSWSWHEVWLIGFGGTLFMSFPAIYASAFAGFYFAFFLLLWALILRGISIEVRHLIDDPLWFSWWDGILWLSSTALAFVIGVAAANILRGVPLDAHGDFSLPLFTNFEVHGQVGLIDWYSLPVGFFAILAFAAHGAAYVSCHSRGEHQERACRVASRLWRAVLCCLPVVTVLTLVVRKGYFHELLIRPSAYLGLAMLAAGAVTVAIGSLQQRSTRIFAGGCLLLFGLVASAGAVIFPIMLFSTTSAPSLSAFNTAIPGTTLAASLIWWMVSALLVIGYGIFVLRTNAQTSTSHS